MAAPAASDAASCCSLYRCICCWRRACSPRIPRVAPGRDYFCMPAGADDQPAWSLVVGCRSLSLSFSDSALRLHRFRVTRCGRVLGGSNDALEVLQDVRAEDKKAPAEKWCLWTASATQCPDGHSLCIFCEDFDPVNIRYSAPPQVLRLDVNAEDKLRKLSPMPRPPLEPHWRFLPISAAGQIWAAYVVEHQAYETFSVGMQLLDEDGQWELAGGTLTISSKVVVPEWWGGRFLQGYVVLSDRAILLSFRQAEFFIFSCHSLAWTQVITQHINTYIPIRGHGVYIKEDNTVYMLYNNDIYAYELRKPGQKEFRRLSYQDGQLLELQPPVKVDSVCPFSGYGFLTQLDRRLLCSVWIGRGGDNCSCNCPHVLISTFLVNPKGIEILHSTCRRLDMLPNNFDLAHSYEYCFLQACEEDYNQGKQAMLPVEDPIRSHIVESSETMLACCRKFLFGTQFPGCVVLEEPAIRINKDLYIVCQVGSHSVVYKTEIVNGRLKQGCHDNPLGQAFTTETFPRTGGTTETVIPAGDDCHVLDRLSEQHSHWHVLCSSSFIHAISCTQDDIHVFNLSYKAHGHSTITRPATDPFVMVVQVGHETIALTANLQVFCHTASKWAQYKIDGSLVHNWKVNLSGYAVLSDNSFIVSDTETRSCLLLDVRTKRWCVVMPAYRFCRDRLFNTAVEAPLNGRSVFVEGFIYTCSTGGLAAYDLFEKGDSMYLDDPIFLPFTWPKSWESDMMCLDYVAKDRISGAIIFCVVQGENLDCSSGWLPSCSRRHRVHITTVQVKTETTNGKMKPVRIDHVDVGTCFIDENKGLVSTRCCFAVGT
ncbi:hypothetical protein VPH35_129845 [Triticum aestivum]|uniref:Uncharacterized protein n=2 Tax=Triticum TaxID=4564 RepID=A0A9R1C174_TRITD|nr:unnamed protein product [Triticum turgidum subsp. durum]